jgi:ERCC4-type nuclease
MKVQIQHGFRLLESVSTEHSATLIHTLIDKLDPKDPGARKWVVTETHDFTKNNASLTAVHTKKRANREAGKSWTRMLLQVEGVSNHKATKVESVFPSPADLIREYDRVGEESLKKRVADIDVSTYGSAKRARLGPKFAGRIVDCMATGR